MSADTTVIIVGKRVDDNKKDPWMVFSAAVVQNVEDFYDKNTKFALKRMRELFPNRWTWFGPEKGLEHVKQFADLLARDCDANGVLEYTNRPIFEVDGQKLWLLTDSGKRNHLAHE